MTPNAAVEVRFFPPFPPGRKIVLDQQVYCPVAYCEGGERECDHDYPPEPYKSDFDYATWQCTRCGMRTTFEVWD
jgi:hypothetical protein